MKNRKKMEFRMKEDKSDFLKCEIRDETTEKRFLDARNFLRNNARGIRRCAKFGMKQRKSDFLTDENRV